MNPEGMFTVFYATLCPLGGNHFFPLFSIFGQRRIFVFFSVPGKWKMVGNKVNFEKRKIPDIASGGELGSSFLFER